MAVTVIYVDVSSGTCYDASGAQIVNDNRLESFIDSHETYEIHYVTDGGAAGLPENWTPYTGFQGSSVASAFGVDNNFVHQYESELQGEGITKGDTISSVAVSLAIEEMLIPKAGLLVLRNAAGEEQTFEYSARTGGNGAYTFSIVSTEAEYDFAAGSIVAVPEALMVLAEGTSTENPENYVDDSRKDNGIFTAHWWNMSDKIMSYFDFESIEEMDAIIEHAITVNGETVKRIQQSITLRKPLIFHRPASVPSVNNQRIASQTWVLSILRGTMEYQFSVDGENDWHAAQTEDDRFYRERPENLAGEWGSAIRMVQGTAGTGINPKGVWNENTTYAIHDMVRGNNATWISKSDGNTGNALPVLPEESNEWWYLNQKDGSVISSVEKTGSAGLTDTYTITTSTNATFTFTVTNGKGISTIAKTSTNGNVDTYTITFNDGTSMTFTVTNGTDGTDGEAATIQITDTETLEAGNNASFEELSGSTAQARKYKARIPAGNGISSITKTGTNGNVDTYTVAFTNGTSTTFTVTNGLNGEDGTAATIQIGSVTQGDTPSVANSGTPGAAVLDFVLPKGSTGSQGAAAISFAVLTAVTDETAFTGTARLVNADGTAGETVDVVYWFADPAATTEG